MLSFVSMGWGVQSWTLAAMVALGELPRVDGVLFSDTSWERSATYEFAGRMASWLQARDVPLVWLRQTGVGGTKVIHNGSVVIPAFTVGKDGERGRIRRQCTGDWKIGPQRAYLRKVRNGQPVELWLGISTDEWQRAKDADVKYLIHRWPLLEKGMSRQDCVKWLEDHSLPVPPKSSCVFCPFQTKAAWEEMRRENGQDWRIAVAVDGMIRDARLPGQLFIHQKRVALGSAVEVSSQRFTQADLLASDDSDAECDSGHCFL